METFDFDRHFRRMERADDAELVLLQQELNEYLQGDEQDERKMAWKQALTRLRERSAAELALVRELIGTSKVV